MSDNGPPTDESPKVVPLRERGEGELLVRHLQGDGDAFTDLVEAWRRPVFSYLVRSGVPAAQRDDLFQEIFLKIHLAADRYDPARPLKPWLFTIVVNATRNWLRDHAAASVASLDGGLDDVLSDAAPGPRRAASARETLAWLEEAIPSLPTAHREALLLCAVEGMERREAARSLGIPVNTVKTHLRRARLALARRLAERRHRLGAAGEETTP